MKKMKISPFCIGEPYFSTITYYRSRVCCDPSNRLGHTDMCIMKNIDRLAGCQSNNYQDLSVAMGEIRTIVRAAIAKAEGRE